MIDFDRINQAALLCLESLCCELLPGGERDGREYKVGDVSGGKGRSMSVNLRTGVWKDFAGDASGSDPISLVAAVHQTKQGEAAKWLNDRLNAGGLEQKAPKAKGRDGTDPDDWEPLPAVPDTAPKPPEELWVGGAKKKLKPVFRWAWHHPDGRLAGYTNRVEWDGKKDVLPICWCRHKSGKEAWRQKSFPKPRLLYRLPDLVGRPEASVLIVEGEKTADAALALLPQCVVTTWPGGCKALAYADWSHLKGRVVMVWPDYDLKTDQATGELLPETEQPGWLAASRIVEALKDLAKSVRLIPPFLGLTKDGWDLADCAEVGVTAEMVVEHIKATREGRRITVPVATPSGDEPPIQDAPPDTLHDHGEPPPPPPPHGDERDDDTPFRILGHNKGLFYYLPNSARQIIELSPTAHSANNLLQLARLSYWEMNYPGKRGFNSLAAANDLMQRAYRVGIFSESLKRGRGCWLDNGKTVYHVGDRLIVDGKAMAIHEFRSRHIYELAESMEPETGEPLSAAEASKLITLCQNLSWERPLNAHLLAGWCVIAPICGVLDYRPSIWITGPSMSGKTTVVNNILKPVIGQVQIRVQGSTTEPGLRGSVGSDARPVVFDEAEAENQRGSDRFKAILELIRTSTSDDAAPIVKGSSSGKVVSYCIRSCFVFSAIGYNATQQADTSRVTPLVLRRQKGPEGEAQYARFKSVMADTVLSPEFCAGIRARTLQLAPVIAENARRFAQSVAKLTGEMRLGQQMGTMLAGAYSLSSSKIISQDDADRWVKERDWSVYAPADAEEDHNRALARLLETMLTLDAAKDRPVQRMSIGEFIDAALHARMVSGAPDWDIRKEMTDLLGRHGIKVMEDGVAISNTHAFLATVFKDTEWAKNWRIPLGRVKGANPAENVIRFTPGIPPTRAVVLPLDLFSE